MACGLVRLVSVCTHVYLLSPHMKRNCKINPHLLSLSLSLSLSPPPPPPPNVAQITELAGYTSRVSEMLKVFEEVDQGHYDVISVAEALAEKKEQDGKNFSNVLLY